MKLVFTGLIALCTVAATFAEEGKFAPAWVEGHNYKVVDGQLVDLGPAPTGDHLELANGFSNYVSAPNPKR